MAKKLKKVRKGLSPKAKFTLGNAFKGLISNQACIDGSRGSAWWVAAIFLVFSSFIYPSKIQGKIPWCNVSTKRERIPVASEKIFLLRLLGEIMYDFMHQLVFLLPKTLFDHGKRISTLGVLPSFSAFQWVSVLW